MTVAAPDRSQVELTRGLIDLAWPIVGINILQVLAIAVDTAMIGRSDDAEAALTGMGYAGQITFLLMVTMFGLTVSAVAFIARAHGAGQPERVRHVLDQSTQWTVILGVVVMIVGNLLATPMLRALGADTTAMAAGLDYLRPLLLGSVFNYLNILYAATLRGVGNTRLAFIIALVMNALNFVFNYGLILGNYGLPALGIQGAAIGTVMAQACAVTMMVALLRRGVIPGLIPTLWPRPFDMTLARDLARVGWAAAADVLVLNAGFLSIIGMLGRIDQAAVAAHGIGLRVQALAFVPGMSISQAVGAMVGNALGAGHPGEARRVLRSGVVLNAAVMSALGFTLIAFDSPLVALFGVAPGTHVHEFATTWMGLLGWSMPVVGVYIAFAGLLQGAGATRTSLRINATLTLLVQIPASYILGFPLGLGAWGVWAAFPLSFIAKAIWAYVEVRRGDWAKTGARA